MAIVKKNLLTKGLSGSIGELVFRQNGDKTSMYVLSPRKSPLSKKQKEINFSFKEAVAKAKRSLKVDSERTKFEALALKQRNRSAYHAAISYYLRKEDN